LERSESIPQGINKQIKELKKEIAKIEEEFFGNKSKNEIGELSDPTIYNRLSFARGGAGNSYGPTPSQKESLLLAEKQLIPVKEELDRIEDEVLPMMEDKLEEVGVIIIR